MSAPTFDWAIQNNTLNTSSIQAAPKVAVDPAGNTYIAYQTDGAVLGGTSTGDSDIVIKKFSNTGSLIWTLQTNQYNTVLTDSAPVIAYDAGDDSVVVAFTTFGTPPALEIHNLAQPILL